jgi:hypothetical protein
MDAREAHELVLAAATRRLGDLLGEAAKYEKLGMQSIVDEYLSDFIGPLQEAIKTVKKETP